MAPNITMPVMKPRALATVNTRFLNRCSGMMGSGARPSHHTNAADQSQAGDPVDPRRGRDPGGGAGVLHGHQEQRHPQHDQHRSQHVDLGLAAAGDRAAAPG